MKPVTLKAKGMKRFEQKHPWIFQDHLSFPRESAVGLYDLFDGEGNWLAKGLLNPKSKIAFRVISDNSEFEGADSKTILEKTIKIAIAERQKWLNENYSCRLIHGESDHLSGLIADLFFTNETVFLVVQSQSAGMDALQGEINEILESWIREFAASKKLKFEILLKNDSSKRARDGLEARETESLTGTGERDREPVRIRVGSLNHPELLTEMKTNLWTGQKTGFFLDQSFNIDVVFEHILRAKKPSVKLLDICSYVGQWSAKLSKGLISKGVAIECTAVDSSSSALAFTKENVETQGGKLNAIRCDVFKADWTVEEKSFDVVICDPPALIKNRDSLEVGKHGYTKLNTIALQKCAKDAIFVSCSCSGVLSRDDFREVLQKAVQRSGRRVLWVGEGRQSPDHPVRDWFPEGEYLKCFVARVLD